MEESQKLIDANRRFMLPSAVGLALMADRPELMQVAITQVNSGEIEITRELVAELMALIANVMHDRREFKDDLNRLKEEVEVIEEEAAKIKAAMREMSKALERASSDIEEDE